MADKNEAIVLEMPPALGSALAPTEHADDMMAALARAAANPNVDPARMTELLKLHRELTADRALVAFNSALARLQSSLPQIEKRGHILNREGKVQSKWAKIEDIDDVIRKPCAEEGFSFAFDSKPTTGGIEFSCKLSHRDGHSETKTLVLPIDNGPGRNAVQSMGSTTSYA